MKIWKWQTVSVQICLCALAGRLANDIWLKASQANRIIKIAFSLIDHTLVDQVSGF